MLRRYRKPRPRSPPRCVVCDIGEASNRVPVVEIEGNALRVKIAGGEAGLDDNAFNLADRIAQTE